MEDIRLRPIGVARVDQGVFSVRIRPEVATGLTGLDGFGHAILSWWADAVDTGPERARTTIERPYPGGPERLGVFATRSPARPNPIGLTVAPILSVDETSGEIRFAWFDLEDGTPVLDVKPYHPSADRVAAPRVPAFCASWPAGLEASATFDWSSIFPD